MAKEIFVEVQKDYLDKVSRANVLNALAELVWNSLDSDATTVEVQIDRGDYGLTAIHVKDNGHGIAFKKAEELFSSLGGSWKSYKNTSPKGRVLHGKEGQGRFKSFSIGRVVEWKTRVKVESSYSEFTIKGLADNKRKFEISDLLPSNLGETGTTVSILEPLAQFKSLNTDRAIQFLSGQLAIYLSAYQDANVYVDGKKVEPSDIILNEHKIRLPQVEFQGEKFDYELHVIEWNKNVNNEFHLSSEEGFPLLKLDKKVKGSNGVSYTAYLKSQHISKLNALHLLGLGDLEPSLKSPIDNAFLELKSYFIQRKIEMSSDQIKKWKEEDIYPYKNDVFGHVKVAEKQMFDVLALNLTELMPEFERSALNVKKLQFQLLKQVIESKPGDLQVILTEVLSLTAKKQSEFAELLQDISLSSIIGATRIVTDRLKIISGIEEILFNPDIKKVLKERSQLHKILAENTWIFGEEFALSVSDKSLTEVLRIHLENEKINLKPDASYPVKRLDGSIGIVDLMLSRSIGHSRANEREHLVIELKAPKVKIGKNEIGQVESYAFAVADDERFKSLKTRWTFWVISNDFDKYTERKLTNDTSGQGILHCADGITIKVKRWSELINECKHRLEFIRDKLDLNIDGSSGLEYLQKQYAEFTKGLSTESTESTENVA